MIRLGFNRLSVAFGVLIATALPAAAADIAVLDVPGAIHLRPATALLSRPPSGLSLISPANAAPSGSLSSHLQVPAVRLTGYILPGDAEKMRSTLETLASYPAAKVGGPLTAVELSSLGGSLMEGFAIGGMLRQYGVIGVVRSHDLCLSSCALALIGGNVQEVPESYPTRCNVEIGGQVAFHNFFLGPSAPRDSTETDPVASRMQGFADARGGAAALVKYAATMGMPPRFVASLLGRPPDQFQYVETIGDFLSLGICPVGLTRPAISIEDQAKNICTNSRGGSEANVALEVQPLPAPGVKRYLLERLQAHMLSSRARGRLAGLLANAAVMRVPEEIDRLYEDLRLAGAALPEIVGPTYEVGQSRAGIFATACYVSLSPDDPDNFDVVLSGASGLSEPRHLPPQNARRLFLFAKDALVNPRRT